VLHKSINLNKSAGIKKGRYSLPGSQFTGFVLLFDSAAAASLVNLFTALSQFLELLFDL